MTRTLAEAASLDEASVPILRSIAEGLGWDWGAVWKVDRPAGVLRCVATWHAPELGETEFEEATRRLPLAPGVGLPGRIWAGASPLAIDNVVADRNFPRAHVASEVGLHGAFGFPIVLRGDVLGVMEFYSREVRPPDAALLRMMGTIGSQIGQCIERKRAEEGLRASEERLRVLFEQMPGILWTTDPELRFTSSSGTALAGPGPTPGWPTGRATLFEYFGTDDPDFLPIDAHRRALGGDSVSYRQEWGGRTFQAHVEPLLDRDRRVVGCIGVALDTTQLERAEEALRRNREEFRIAGEIQKVFYPKAMAAPAGFDIHGDSRPRSPPAATTSTT